MRRTAQIPAALLLIAGLASPAAAQTAERLDKGSLQEAGEAAREALATFARLVDRQNFEELGFASPGEVATATLGDPIEEFMIGLDSLQAYEPDQRGLELFPTRRLTYPVLAGGDQRSSLTVGRGGDGWAAVSFGGASYSRLLSAARRVLSADGRPPSDVFELRVPALNVSFAARQEGDGVVVTPVVDDARFGFERGATLSLDEALEALLPAAREHNGLPT